MGSIGCRGPPRAARYAGRRWAGRGWRAEDGRVEEADVCIGKDVAFSDLHAVAQDAPRLGERVVVSMPG